jgi:hypothetical protein
MDGNSQKVTRAFLLSRIFSTPLWALITLLPYILYKDLHISIFLVTLTLALKPLSALLAPYFSLKSYKQPKKLLKNTIKGNFLRYVPFFFLPLFPSPFFTLSAFFFYMIFSRGITPAWMELIKQHIPADQRELVFQRGNTFEYVGMILMPFVLGSILD